MKKGKSSPPFTSYGDKRPKGVQILIPNYRAIYWQAGIQTQDTWHYVLTT